MSCHGDKKGNNESHNHSPMKHMLHMIICCGLPIIVISALPLIARYSPETGGFLARIAPFLCPILMLSMLPMMLRNSNKGSCCDVKSMKDEKQVESNGSIS